MKKKKETGGDGGAEDQKIIKKSTRRRKRRKRKEEDGDVGEERSGRSALLGGCPRRKRAIIIHANRNRVPNRVPNRAYKSAYKVTIKPYKTHLLLLLDALRRQPVLGRDLGLHRGRVRGPQLRQGGGGGAAAAAAAAPVSGPAVSVAEQAPAQGDEHRVGAGRGGHRCRKC
jgi:hypothetical protein